MDRLRQILASNMKLTRKKLGYSQLKLAEECDASTSYIGEIEIGRKFPSSQMLLRIADALKIKPHRLFYDPRDEDTPIAQMAVSEFREELFEAICTDIDRILSRFVDQGEDK